MNHAMLSDYMAHGFCFSREPGMVWLHVASGTLAGLAYYAIAIAIAIAMAWHYLKRRDLPFVLNKRP